MNKFLLKTEPSVYSFDDLLRDKTTVWDGVANSLALKHLRSMKKGDQAFFYHTGDEKQIVGIVSIHSDPYQDPKNSDPKLAVVEVKGVEKLKKPVTLAAIKGEKRLARFPLVTIGRLSVMPVSDAEWDFILSLSH
ncbi:MAG: EVE domain-containing protein [Bacteroidota bacterium]|jgi:predicted RNA-binding protein with PUA-like domain